MDQDKNFTELARAIHKCALLLVLLPLVACGGGASSSLGPPVTALPAPVVPLTTTGTLQITTYPLPRHNTIPNVITTGPDGALWFTELGENTIGRVTTSGAFTEFTLPSGTEAWSITSGPDGALWYTELAFQLNKIGRITTAGTVTEYTGLTAQSAPIGIVTGPDGALWFAEQNSSQIGRITTQGVISEYPLATKEEPSDIIVGPDGALWFTEFTGSIGRITTAGAITEFPDTISPNSNHESMATGSDGALWFTTNPRTLSGILGRLTTAGSYTEYVVPFIDAVNEPRRVVSAPDGAIWFLPATSPAQLARMTTAGVLTLYPLPANTAPYNLAVGPDGALWMTAALGGYILRITPSP